jgi:hypothetical protein
MPTPSETIRAAVRSAEIGTGNTRDALYRSNVELPAFAKALERATNVLERHAVDISGDYCRACGAPWVCSHAGTLADIASLLTQAQEGK